MADDNAAHQTYILDIGLYMAHAVKEQLEMKFNQIKVTRVTREKKSGDERHT